MGESPIDITFAIPFYSTPEYLAAAIKSVQVQSYPHWHLIVVDDRSPHPGIREQVESYNDPRITYHLNDKNLGQAGNWNQCLERAPTDFVTILHADDMLQPHYAQTIVDGYHRFSDATAIFCRADIVDGHGKRIFTLPDLYKGLLMPSRSEPFVLQGEAGLQALIRGNFIMCPTLCYRRSALRTHRFSPNFKCAPDFDFTSRILIDGARLVGLPAVAFSYRRHEESGTAAFRKSLQQFEEEIKLLDLIASRCESARWRTAAAAAHRKTIVKLRLAFFGIRDLLLMRFRASLEKFSLASRVMLGT